MKIVINEATIIFEGSMGELKDLNDEKTKNKVINALGGIKYGVNHYFVPTIQPYQPQMQQPIQQQQYQQPMQPIMQQQPIQQQQYPQQIPQQQVVEKGKNKGKPPVAMSF